MDTILISKFEEGDFDTVLVPNRTVKKANLGDRCTYYVIVGCGLKMSKSLPLFIKTDEGAVPILDKFGNRVFSNQLRNRYRYCIGYGNNNDLYEKGQFILYNPLCLPSPTAVAPDPEAACLKRGDK